MTKKGFSIGIIFLALMVCTTCTKDEVFHTPEGEPSALKSTAFGFSPEVEAAIVTGIDWLLLQQNPDGNFGGSSDGVARTALAVTKLCDRSVELGQLPMEGPYATQIESGLNYIFDYAVSNPDGGIYLSNTHFHSVYNTGIAMMAIAAARCPDCTVAGLGPLAGMSFSDVLQETVDFFVTAQNPDGAWRYHDHSQPSDNSNTGFAVLGLIAAEKAGIVIPQSLRDNLSVFIDLIQDDVTGGSKYQEGWDWINTMKTGNLLFEMAFVGDAQNAPRVVHALEYLGNHWNDNNNDPGWQSNYLAMYCLMKGFLAMRLETVMVGGSDVDWYDDFVTEILGAPHWPLPAANWTDPYLSSVLSLLTIEKFAPIPPPPYQLVDVDVKPESCPNPLNRTSDGVIPIAILGTEEFDVTTIDPESVNIGGVYPLRWSLEDVATPYTGGLSDPATKMDCNRKGPDGFMDLVFHFNTTYIATLFADKEKKDVIIIQVDGQLVDDGLEILGEDVMVVIK